MLNLEHCLLLWQVAWGRGTRLQLNAYLFTIHTPKKSFSIEHTLKKRHTYQAVVEKPPAAVADCAGVALQATAECSSLSHIVEDIHRHTVRCFKSKKITGMRREGDLTSLAVVETLPAAVAGCVGEGHQAAAECVSIYNPHPLKQFQL